jgi:hypothetical protein
LAIAELIEKLLDLAETHYRNDGEPTATLARIRRTLRPLNELYGLGDAATFGPLKPKALRDSLIDTEICRVSIDEQIGIVKQIFKWAVKNELVPAPRSAR